MSNPSTAGETQLTEIPGLDPVIHAQPRLRVVFALTTLGRDDRITFPRLQELLSMTAGNLSTHLHKLEETDYVIITKAYRHRNPVTYVALSQSGRRAFEDYTEALRALLDLNHGHHDENGIGVLTHRSSRLDCPNGPGHWPMQGLEHDPSCPLLLRRSRVRLGIEPSRRDRGSG